MTSLLLALSDRPAKAWSLATRPEDKHWYYAGDNLELCERRSSKMQKGRQIRCNYVVNAPFQEMPLVTLKEPACGVGRMVLAFSDALNQAGYAPHRYLWFSATDIDPLAAGITYIQLSLCGVAGEVVIGNVLRNERRRILYTPGHYPVNWFRRLNVHQGSAA